MASIYLYNHIRTAQHYTKFLRHRSMVRILALTESAQSRALSVSYRIQLAVLHQTFLDSPDVFGYFRATIRRFAMILKTYSKIIRRQLSCHCMLRPNGSLSQSMSYAYPDPKDRLVKSFSRSSHEFTQSQNKSRYQLFPFRNGCYDVERLSIPFGKLPNSSTIFVFRGVPSVVTSWRSCKAFRDPSKSLG